MGSSKKLPRTRDLSLDPIRRSKSLHTVCLAGFGAAGGQCRYSQRSGSLHVEAGPRPLSIVCGSNRCFLVVPAAADWHPGRVPGHRRGSSPPSPPAPSLSPYLWRAYEWQYVSHDCTPTNWSGWRAAVIRVVSHLLATAHCLSLATDCYPSTLTSRPPPRHHFRAPGVQCGIADKVRARQSPHAACAQEPPVEEGEVQPRALPEHAILRHVLPGSAWTGAAAQH